MSSSTSFTSAPQPQLIGQHARLQRELAQAFYAHLPSRGLIERIVSDLAHIEHALPGDRWLRSHASAARAVSAGADT
jgi:hypothetical protein